MRWSTWGAGTVLALGLLAACGSTTKSNHQGGSAGDGPSAIEDGTITSVRQTAVDKIDLLLTIDNSSSMKDKQLLLQAAVPYLLQRLITPRCVHQCTASDNCTARQESEGIPTGGNADETGHCTTGLPEMAPLRDLHIGVISSSLGSHGATGATALCTAASENDHAQLLGTLRGVSGTFEDQGFLAWDTRPGLSADPDALTDPSTLMETTSQLIEAAGDGGCELPATLESWYRFLIDPAPPADVVVNDQQQAEAQGVDQTLLTQRAAFLRPDSIVVIGMLSDKNDCSVADEGSGWLVASSAPMNAGTSACAADPNDPCCISCAETTVPGGCPAPATDASCQKSATLAPADDAPGVRCWHQKARFGIDLLYPVTRYSEALKSPVVADKKGQPVQNPLFAPASGHAPRDRGLVQLTAIVGVPWQDIADDESLASPTSLHFSPPYELEARGRWDVLLGAPDSQPPILPTDPFMIEQVAERAGVNPITVDSIAPSTSTSPTASRINGHEHANVSSDDLQYACIFPLPTPRDCSTLPAGTSCDCSDADIAKNSPLCQPTNGGAAGSTQYYAKAYPGTRFVQVVKQLPEQSLLASICPKIFDEKVPGYGYLPAMDGLAGSVRSLLRAKCFSAALPVKSDGRLDGCRALATLPAGASCDCEGQGLSAAASADAFKARSAMQAQQECDVDGTPACRDVCVCQIPELSGDDLAACQSSVLTPNRPGFCYINAQDHEHHVGNPELLRDCSADAKRLVRFVGSALPDGAEAFVTCDQPFFSSQQP